MNTLRGDHISSLVAIDLHSAVANAKALYPHLAFESRY